MAPCLTDVVSRGRGHPTPTFLRGHRGSMKFVAFLSHDQLISASDVDGTIRRWSLSGGHHKVVKELVVSPIAVSPNKRLMALGGRDGRVRLVDLETPSKEAMKSDGRHADVVKSLSFSSDSSQVATGAQDGTVFVWSSKSLTQIVGPIQAHMDSVWWICYSPDGKKIASCDRESIHILNGAGTDWAELKISVQAWSLTWSGDGNSLFAGCIDGSIKHYNPDTGVLRASYPAHDDVVSSIVLSHDAKFVATASLDKTVRLWEATTFQQIGPALPHEARVCSISISPDSSHLVSGARDPNIRVWNLRTIAPVLFSFFPLEPNRGQAKNTLHLPWGKPTRDSVHSHELGDTHIPQTKIQIPTDSSGEGPQITDPVAPRHKTSLDIMSILNRRRGGTIDSPRTPASSTQGSSSVYTDSESLRSGSSRHLLSPSSPTRFRRQANESENREFIREIRSDPTHDLTGSIAGRKNLVSGGSHGDIYRGTLNMNGRSMRVAIKVIKIYSCEGDVQSKQKRLRREMELWLRLDHRNVIPVLGMANDYGEFPAMVCPWAENGTLADFIDRRESDLMAPMRMCIINDVALGLHYLHSKSIAHGDISGSNVLIYGSGRACIADFGLSVVVTEIEGCSEALSYRSRTTIRWTAPELLDFRTVGGKSEKVPKIFPTSQSDVYSFGGIMLHVLTGKHPYHDYPYDDQVILALSRGERPQRPTSTAVVTDDQWEFMKKCWSVEPGDRPCDAVVVTFVHEQLLEAVAAYDLGELTLRMCGEAVRENLDER